MLQAQSEFADFHGLGHGIVEASHRSAAYKEIQERAEANIRELLAIDEDHEILFLQGGASLQFAMVPMNLMLPGRPALYADTGVWPCRAIQEARLMGEVEVVFDGKPTGYSGIGDPTGWQIRQDASYAFICTNNTIEGTQYRVWPETGAVPLVADMSSDILSRPVDVSRFGLIFAGAQKNIGPAGVTLVILRKELLSRVPPQVPAILRYSTHSAQRSVYNTPPVFAVYMVALVTDWLKKLGGLQIVDRLNTAKSRMLYDAIDSSGFYRGTAQPNDRSKMNVTFRLPDEGLESRFIREAEAAGLVGLKGHRAVGGIRASCYNAMPKEGVLALVDFMADFQKRNG